MSHDSPSRPPLYTPLDISAADATEISDAAPSDALGEQTELLTNISAALDRQNELLEELVGHMCRQQRQRNQELKQWRAANPTLARSCRRAAETLGRVQTDFLDTLTREVNENADALADGDFLLNEFVDRFGPRMAHLNGVLQVLAQLSGTGG